MYSKTLYAVVVCAGRLAAGLRRAPSLRHVGWDELEVRNVGQEMSKLEMGARGTSLEEEEVNKLGKWERQVRLEIKGGSQGMPKDGEIKS